MPSKVKYFPILISQTGEMVALRKQKNQSIFFKKGANPGLFFVYFRSFQTNQCEKMSIPSSIWCKDSNTRPFNRESSPITTRRGLPPLIKILLLPLKRWKERVIWGSVVQWISICLPSFWLGFESQSYQHRFLFDWFI